MSVSSTRPQPLVYSCHVCGSSYRNRATRDACAHDAPSRLWKCDTCAAYHPSERLSIDCCSLRDNSAVARAVHGVEVTARDNQNVSKEDDVALGQVDYSFDEGTYEEEDDFVAELDFGNKYRRIDDAALTHQPRKKSARFYAPGFRSSVTDLGSISAELEYHSMSNMSFKTARSTWSSFRTAPSSNTSLVSTGGLGIPLSCRLPHRRGQIAGDDLPVPLSPAEIDNMTALEFFVGLWADHIASEAWDILSNLDLPPLKFERVERLKQSLAGLIQQIPHSNSAFTSNELYGMLEQQINAAISILSESIQFDKKADRRAKKDIARHLYDFLSSRLPYLKPHLKVFSSEWLEYLDSRGILADPKDELDWSGRGQHVEYDVKEEKDVPLRVEKVLGHSATALVESVMCRRIRLARKTIRCNRRLTREDAINEVEHLQRLRHRHIVRVVGTYTLRRDLAILLYPAADWDLDEFMDETVQSRIGSDAELEPRDTSKLQALITFIGCLAKTVVFLHDNNVKHMDIKPKNILVRNIPRTRPSEFRIYIADFGIARAYQSAAEVETDSPTSYTRTYAAPEVVQQDKRGFSADVFSLGCVFAEMLATIASVTLYGHAADQRTKLMDARCSGDGDTSYQANIKGVRSWLESTRIMYHRYTLSPLVIVSQSIWELTSQMINETARRRPTAQEVMRAIDFKCGSCSAGPEPFEAAMSSTK